MKKSSKYFFISILTIIAIIVGCSYFVFVNTSIKEKHQFIDGISQKTNTYKRDRKWLESLPDDKREQWTEKSVIGGDRLTANYLPANEKTDKTIIIAHGYDGSKETVASYVRMFHNMGYNVLSPDDHGSGQSQGKYIGFGYPDRLDYKEWINQVIKHNGKKSKIVLFGVSMGAATVMMTAGEHLPEQVKAIIEDSGYTSIIDELSYQLKNIFKLPKFPFLYIVNMLTEKNAHYDMFDGSSKKALEKNKLPVFFIHGSEDKFVPTEMVYENYHANKGPKQIWIVDGAAHAEPLQINPQLYHEKVQQFIEKYTN